MTKFEHQTTEFKWIDIEDPTPEELLKIADDHSLPLQALTTCLAPEHLPKCEVFRDVLFFIIRHHDIHVKHNASTVQELTTKLVFFIGKDFVITLHRSPLPCITEKKNKIQFENVSLLSLVKHLCLHTLKTFDAPLDELDSKTEIIEGRVFSLHRRNILREGYMVKRRISAYRKIFKFTVDILHSIQTILNIPNKELSAIRDNLEKHTFYADNIHEEITGLLNLHLSLMSQKTNEASYRTNEVMRVLTVFSIFFLPLNFIAGIYGMNFENMPELKWTHGYFVTLFIMFMLVSAITLWIYRKGWLKKDEL